MKKQTRIAALAAFGLASVMPMVPASASSTGIQVPLVQMNTSGFGDVENTSARLFRLTPEMGADDTALYAVTTNDNGIQLWKSTDAVARNWEAVSSAALTADSTNTSVVDIAVMDNALYVLVNAQDGFEVWQWTATAEWTNVFEQHGSSTLSSMMKKAGDALYVGGYSTASGLAQLYKSTDGTTWEEYAEPGLVADVAMVTDVAKLKGDLYAVTNDGRVLHTEQDGPTFSIAYQSELEGAEFAIARRFGDTLYIGGGSDAGALFISTQDGESYTVITQDGFGDPANTAVTQLKEKSGRIAVYMENGTGFDMYRMTNPRDNTSFELWIDAGATSTHNTAVADVVKYRGRQYFSTTNTVEGAQVGLFQLRAPRPTVTSPSMGDAVTAGEITFTGTAQPGNRIDVRFQGETIGTTIVDEFGNWSVTVNITEEGHEVVRIIAQYQDSEGNAMGRLSKPVKVDLHIQ